MESQFTLTSIDTNTVTYDLGGGEMPCESSFYAAGYGDFIAIEHHTMKYFGTRQVPVSAVTVNGATFATDTEAVEAINKLDVFVSGGASGGGTDPETPTPILRDVTEMFEIPTDADIKVMMIEDGIGKPMIQIHGVYENDVEMVIIPAFGFGPYNTKTKVVWGVDSSGSDASYHIEVVGETDVTQGKIIIPAGVDYFDLTYFVGSTVASVASYWINTAGITYPFEYENTPISKFGNAPVINGVSVNKSSIRELFFGTSYAGVESIDGERFILYDRMQTISLHGFSGVKTVGSYVLYGCSALKELDISPLVGANSIGDRFAQGCSSLKKLICGSFDASKNATNTPNSFSGVPNDSTCTRSHATQALADAFVAKYPAVSNWTVVIEP
jgi:hypothetical protein